MRRVRALLLALGLIVSACGFGVPQTDITATSTEVSGPWAVQQVRNGPGHTRSAQVCVGRWADADKVATNLVRQWTYEGYASVTLDLYPADSDDAGREVTWIAATATQTTRPVPPAATQCRIDAPPRFAPAASREPRTF